jgi:hypothetical protein
MNRLSPLIVRRVGPFAVAAPYPDQFVEPEAVSDLLEDLKTFAVAWVGGLVFFATFLG